MPARTDPHRRGPLASVAVVLLALGLAACGGGAADDPPQVLQGMVREPPLEVGEVVAPEVDARGEVTDFRFRARPGGLLLVAFGYTHCPDVCPTTLSEFRTAIGRLGDRRADRIDVAFYTVDPGRDTPEIVTAYLGSFVDGGHALRAEDFKALRVAEKAFNVSSTIREDTEQRIVVTHTARSFVVDEHGTVVLEWAFGVGSDVMADDLGMLFDRIDQGRS